MTGFELSSFLLSEFNICHSFCGTEWNYVCSAIIYGGCPHEVSHDMYHIAVDMLETA